jgi:hypothetical protein
MEFPKLSSEQIDNLFEFCEFHNVRYYDVQIELVDHLASAIEKLWETNPELPFEEAVYVVGEQFNIEAGFHATSDSLLPPIAGTHFSGESGFEIIKEAKENELRRKYDRLQWKYIQEFFRLPKIILTIAVTLVIFFIFKFSENDDVVCGIIQGIFLVSLLAYWKLSYLQSFKLEIQPGKSFLLYEHFKSTRKSLLSLAFSSPGWIIFIGKITRLKSDAPILSYINFQLFAAFLITLFGIMIIVIGVYTPRRIKEDFTREFPQFIIS